jgi:hypothetical protein
MQHAHGDGFHKSHEKHSDSQRHSDTPRPKNYIMIVVALRARGGRGTDYMYRL